MIPVIAFVVNIFLSPTQEVNSQVRLARTAENTMEMYVLFDETSIHPNLQSVEVSKTWGYE